MCINKSEIVWNNIQIETRLLINSEPELSDFIYKNILQHKNFKQSLIYILSNQLSKSSKFKVNTTKIFYEAYRKNKNIINFAIQDIYAIRWKDPAVNKYYVPLLYFKGFHALQIYRIANWLWTENRQALAMYLHNQISVIFGVDIHPAASIGYGVILDHGTGIVIGETAIIENNVSIMQSVTLGSTGKILGNRHPKIRKEVIIGAGAIILGNIEIGPKTKIGAGSIVLHSTPSKVTVTGNPAKIIKK